ncbi:hypothetical protein HHK36_017226 [Tetracentron sinense]|uniref:Uncharacterized protein n=1 Tax=Tetracentron sinense TaxID=13715 RepID=A0A835DFH3_TETSI|nr:hypothetical protein HHK36_017226 [Tetracentron sinense]
MVSMTRCSWVFSLNAINGVSSSPSTNLRTRPSRIPQISASLSDSNAESPLPNSLNSSEDESGSLDPAKVAFAKAKAYKKLIQSKPTPKQVQNPVSESSEIGNTNNGSVSVKLAMEKARKYKMNKGDLGIEVSISNNNVEEKDRDPGLEEAKVGILGDGFVEKMVIKKEEPKISGIDFIGLDFSDKKMSRRLPAGLVPFVDPFPEGDLPEVELIVGDNSKFGAPTPLELEPTEEDNSDFYKPKVSTWGVFPRPGNISKTFGGGRVIRPGEVLETEEDKAAKQARTKELLAAYKKKMGLNIDAKLKSECEKAMKEGDYLMVLGKLKEALPYYEKVMNKLPFQSELHGVAALQWSVCQDSLSRPNEARLMYEKLQSHPIVQVRKKARQFLFSFQAMEMMKLTRTSFSPKATDYQNYFEAFIEDKANYPLRGAEDKEDALSQVLPYIMFLASPILIVLFIAIQKGM